MLWHHVNAGTDTSGVFIAGWFCFHVFIIRIQKSIQIRRFIYRPSISVVFKHLWIQTRGGKWFFFSLHVSLGFSFRLDLCTFKISGQSIHTARTQNWDVIKKQKHILLISAFLQQNRHCSRVNIFVKNTWNMTIIYYYYCLLSIFSVCFM